MSHITGKVYDMNQENWNKLISELEAAQARIAKLEAALRQLGEDEYAGGETVKSAKMDVWEFCQEALK